jgi:hypothetical protein
VWVKTLLSPHFSGFDTLAVNNTNTWLRVALGLGPYIAPQQRVNMLPSTASQDQEPMLPELYSAVANVL